MRLRSPSESYEFVCRAFKLSPHVKVVPILQSRDRPPSRGNDVPKTDDILDLRNFFLTQEHMCALFRTIINSQLQFSQFLLERNQMG